MNEPRHLRGAGSSSVRERGSPYIQTLWRVLYIRRYTPRASLIYHRRDIKSHGLADWTLNALHGYWKTGGDLPHHRVVQDVPGHGLWTDADPLLAHRARR